MEEMTLEDFGQLVICACEMGLFPGQEQVMRDALAALQSDPRYRDWLEGIEVGDYPTSLHLADETYGGKLLRPWLQLLNKT